MILGAPGELCLALQSKETFWILGQSYIYFGMVKIIFQDMSRMVLKKVWSLVWRGLKKPGNIHIWEAGIRELGRYFLNNDSK